MERDLDVIRSKFKNKKKKVIKIKSNMSKYVTRICLTVILTLITLIVLKDNTKLKANFYKYVYDNNISFASINKTYKSIFGSPLPFQDLWNKKTEMVFNEKLEYKEQHKYKDGVELIVDNNYLVPIIESGMVVFIGDKEGYGNTVIIQQMDGIDVWYSNIKTANVKLYDYVEKGALLGEVKESSLYLVYKKNGNVLNYEEYI